MKDILTAYEASLKYKISASHLRNLMRNGKVDGKAFAVSPSKSIWLIKESSLKTYLSKPRPTGPKSSKK